MCRPKDLPEAANRLAFRDTRNAANMTGRWHNENDRTSRVSVACRGVASPILFNQPFGIFRHGSTAWQNSSMDTELPTIGQLVWRWLELHGLNAKQLFEDQELSWDDIQSHRERVAGSKWDRIVLTAMNEIDDRCAGLRAARCWHPSDLGALGYAWLASSTLRTAFSRMDRYLIVISERANTTTRETKQGFTVLFRQDFDDSALRAVAADFAMSITLDMCRFNFGASLTPVEVTLQREEPDCAAEYVNFYGCNIQFSAQEDSFTLMLSDVDKLLPSSNKQLAGVHDRVLAQQLASIKKEDVVARCKAIILENLTTGEMSFEQIAQELHMSSRTLTRRLESKETTLQQLLDETRSELARHYLADPRNSLSEVTFLLGFSHQSSLTRASNRWFGMPPKRYRSQCERGDASIT